MDRVLPLDPYTLAVVNEPWHNRQAGVKGSAVRHEAFTFSMEEIVHCIEQAGLTPDKDNLTQLWQALGVNQATETVKGKAEIATIAEARAGTDDTRIITPLKLAQLLPQRIAFGQYFTDDNPVVVAQTNYDNDGDANTMPSAALKLYEYSYPSAFASEKTVVNIILISNLVVTRPGTVNVQGLCRGRILNAASVTRNNYIYVDQSQNNTAISANAKSLAFSMFAAKEQGTASLTIQVYAWWSALQAAVAGTPYQMVFDDIEMLIVERVVSTLPTLTSAD